MRSQDVVYLAEPWIVAAATFLVTVLLTRPLIGWLQGREFGKAIRIDGPDHAAKAGTPTMGGIAMLAAIGLAAGYVAWRFGTVWPLWVVLAMTLFAALGLIDDLHGLARRSGTSELGVGLTARRMLLLQAIAAVSIVALLSTTTWASVWLGILRGDWYYIVLFAATVIAIVGAVNGANMSDGLDGLAAGLGAIAFAAYSALFAVTAYLQSVSPTVPADRTNWALAVLAASVAAACLGFLVFNRHPARVFMGNVTSMALGAGLVMIALGAGTTGLKLLPVIGLVFVIEVLSVLLQVAYFKATGGKRIFLMAPIHHHFEALGWPEVKVVRRFWLAGAVSAVVGFVLVLYAVSGSTVPFLP